MNHAEFQAAQDKASTTAALDFQAKYDEALTKAAIGVYILMKSGMPPEHQLDDIHTFMQMTANGLNMTVRTITQDVHERYHSIPLENLEKLSIQPRFQPPVDLPRLKHVD